MFVACFIGCLLIGIFLSYLTINKSQPIFKKFRASLSNWQKKKYQAITEERYQICYHSLLMSTIFAILLTYLLNKTSNHFPVFCFFIACLLSMTCIFYLLHPKSDYMVKHLTTEEQRKDWQDISKMYNRQKFIGLVIGALGYFILAGSLFKKNIKADK